MDDIKSSSKSTLNCTESQFLWSKWLFMEVLVYLVASPASRSFLKGMPCVESTSGSPWLISLCHCEVLSPCWSCHSVLCPSVCITAAADLLWQAEQQADITPTSVLLSARELRVSCVHGQPAIVLRIWMGLSSTHLWLTTRFTVWHTVGSVFVNRANESWV